MTVLCVAEFPPGLNPDYTVNQQYLADLLKRACRSSSISKVVQIAPRVREIGVKKTEMPVEMPVLTMFALAGNNLIAVAWASGRATTQQIMRNWGWVYLGNLVGAVGTATLVWLASIQSISDEAVGETMVQTARSKIALDPVSAVACGILFNVLVCLAVWLCMGGRSVTDKILAIVFPITGFVARGFEHSAHNMYLLLTGIALAAGISAATLSR